MNSTTQNKKIVYLTFDDGPSRTNTANILDVLNKNGVKATFFVVGRSAENNKENIKNLKKAGMAIYPHCNIHEYKEVYESKDSYFKDLNCCQSKINKLLGENTKANFVRLPGGSTNLVCKKNVLDSIKKELLNKNIMYIDWNVDSGDASAAKVSSESIKKNIKNSAGTYKIEVVLMHDAEGKKSTATTLDSIIQEYKLLNYEFKTLNNITKEEIQYLKNGKVINRQ
ncbi:MAG: polysaccharide deacetylase family protein [Clostridium sp.]|uniref:polysaccharide deacetylase family protein n=1 Tax=Clostridium sp. TaxID=1506 RepID=UPI003F3FE13C